MMGFNDQRSEGHEQQPPQRSLRPQSSVEQRLKRFQNPQQQQNQQLLQHNLINQQNMLQNQQSHLVSQQSHLASQQSVQHHHPLQILSHQSMSHSNLTQHNLQVQSAQGPRNAVSLTQPTSHSEKKVHQHQPSRMCTIPPTLPVGSSHNAVISHVEDGPFSFCVQLKNAVDDVLPRLKTILNQYSKTQYNQPLTPGNVVLGKCSSNNSFRRCFVTNVKADSCQVYYMDYGNSEELPYSEIYQLPTQALELAPPQALLFRLAELSDMNITPVAKDFFEKLLLNRQVLLRVCEREAGPLYQYCEMYHESRRVKDLLLGLNTPLEYTNQVPPRGRELAVTVSYVDSPTQFFVQYSNEISVLGAIQEALESFCRHQPKLENLMSLNIGSPVASQFSFDEMWYRGLVVGIDGDKVNVYYVDYGNRDNNTVNQLCNISRDLVKKWRSQAVECCLIGFENATPDPILANIMEETCLGNKFILKLHSMLNGNRLSVDLVTEGGTCISKIITAKAEARVLELTKLSISVPKPTSQRKEFNHPSENNSDSGGNKWGRKYVEKDRENNRYIRPPHNEHDTRCDDDYKPRGKVDGGGDRDLNKRFDDGRKSFGGSKTEEVTDVWENDLNQNQKWKLEQKKSDNFYERTRRNDNKVANDRGDRDNRLDKASNRFGADRNVNGGGVAVRFNDRSLSGDKFEKKERFGGDRSDRIGSGRYIDKSERYSDKSDRFGDKNERTNRFSGNVDRNTGDRFGGDKTGTADRGNRYGDRSAYFGDKEGGKKLWTAGADDGRVKRWANKERDYNAKKSYGGEDYKPSSISQKETADTNESWGVDDTETTVISSFKLLNITEGQQLKAYFCHMEAPNDIFVQMFDCDPLLLKLRELIEADTGATSRTISHSNLVKVMPILAKFPEDNLLYRATVRDISKSNTVTVMFVDYGNSVMIPTSETFIITKELADIPVQALRVSLSDVQCPKTGWPEDYTPYDTICKSDMLTIDITKVKLVDGELMTTGIAKFPDGTLLSEKYQEINSTETAEIKDVETNNSEKRAVTPTQEQPLAPIPEVAQTSGDEKVEEKTTETGIWTSSFDLLIGQYLYSQIVFKVNKNLFILKIEAANVMVLAELCNGKILRNDTPKEVIVNLQSLGDDRWIVNLYDREGNGLEVGDGDCPKISPVCPMPVISKSDKVFISSSDGPILYVQRTDDNDKITNLLEELFDLHDPLKYDDSIEWKNDMICCAKSSDGNWYRSRITDEKGIWVRFIDYGNIEKVEKQNLRVLNPKFYSLSEMALGIYLPVEWKLPVPKIAEVIDEVEFKAKIYRDTIGKWIFDLTYTSNDENIVVKLVKAGLATENTSVIENQPISWDLKVGQRLGVVVSHVDSLALFWIQLNRDLVKIDEMGKVIEESHSNKPLGKVFAALYDSDKFWYRAVDNGGGTVCFIDYGNSDEPIEKKALPDEYLKPEKGYALPVCLCVKPIGEQWSEKAINIFAEFIELQLEVQIISLDYKIVVDLFSENLSLSQLLIKSNLGTYTDFTPKEIIDFTEEREKVFISYVKSVNNFYIQEDARSSQLETICGKLIDADKFHTITDCSVGDLVAVQLFEEYKFDSHLWYRAKITSKNPLKAFLIDYGNTTNVTEMKRLPDEVKGWSGCAINCSLDIEETDEINEKFFELYHNCGETPFEIIFKSRGERNVVELRHVGGVSILIDILPSIDTISNVDKSPTADEKKSVESQDTNQQFLDCQETLEQTDSSTEFDECDSQPSPTKILTVDTIKSCVFSYVNGPSEFFVHTPDSLIGLELLNQRLSLEEEENLSATELTLGTKILAKYSDGSGWHRAVLVEPNLIQFIDFGNYCELGEFKSYPIDIDCFPDFALRCCLRKPIGFDDWPDKAINMFNSMVALSIPFDLQLVENSDPKVINIFINGENLSDKIVTDEYDEFKKTKVSNFNTLNDFFLQNVYYLDKIESVLAEGLTKLQTKDINEDELIVCPYEGNMFRARVLSLEPIKVSYIDYGNTEEVTDCYNLSDKIKFIPPLAFHCTLSVDEDKLSDKQIIQRLLEAVEVDYKILSSDAGLNKVEIYINGENILKDLNCKEKRSGVVSYYENLNEIYIHNEVNDLESISKALNISDAHLKSGGLNVGDVIAARNPEDKIWYRGKVLKIEPDLEVEFIDWGNRSYVTDYGDLPESIKDLPSQCRRVKAWKEDGGDWPKAISLIVKPILKNSELMYVIDTDDTIKISCEDIGDVNAYIQTLISQQKKEIDDISANLVIAESSGQDQEDNLKSLDSTLESQEIDEKLPSRLIRKRSSANLEEKIIPGCVTGNI